MKTISNILDVLKYVKNEKYKVILFDLDDTLYSEKEYIKSGFSKISDEYPNIPALYEELWKAFLQKKPAIDYVLSKYSLEEEREKCIDIYRNHKPKISPYPGVISLLKDLKLTKKIGLITDGRPEGQHNKIESLSIGNLFDKIIITDELGGPSFRKPNTESFRIMKEFFKVNYDEMVYIGDNINKDFKAPIELGMDCIYFKNFDGIYS